ncbi:hypothetical protein CAEBREN_00455 [Caenorhabditis brenneri]|uniref:Uncharacterized protein n=1 Tax=Caenorhabditis brenneri TaxID=135651 RepID=G0PBE1_CAEBE|nr:hypothetical protein CAEBREN_00455 [Caenorhabditis brenneri]
MYSSSSSPVNKLPNQTAPFFLSPISLEGLRDQHKQELQKQRNEMNATIQNLAHRINDSKNYIEQLQCSLASEARHKEELNQVLQHFASDNAAVKGHQDSK